jgi:hypothetical protein
MCPLLDAGLWLRYLVTPAEVRFGHPLRNPCRSALRKVEIRGLHNDWWANLMALAFVRTVCAKVATLRTSVIRVAEHVRALANLGQADTGMPRLCQVDARGALPRGRVHKSVIGSL